MYSWLGALLLDEKHMSAFLCLPRHVELRPFSMNTTYMRSEILNKLMAIPRLGKMTLQKSRGKRLGFQAHSPEMHPRLSCFLYFGPSCGLLIKNA